MNNKEQKLTDLREITFWQQLNKRLIELGAEGHAIMPEHHHFLQSFCFENHLFKSIADAHHLFEIPLVLITELDDIAFVTLKMDEWSQCLTEYLRILKTEIQFFVFNLDEALAGAYDALSEIDRRYNLVETTVYDVAADGDETLFDFINQYLDKKENTGGYDFESLISLFHKIRGQFLQLIMSQTSVRLPVERIKDRLMMIPHNKKQKTIIQQIYKDNFLPRLREASTYPIDVLTHNEDLIKYLKEKRAENRSEHIRQFVDAEMKLLREQNVCLAVFNGDITRLVSSSRIYMPNIPIVDLSALSFLNKPFPAITPHR